MDENEEFEFRLRAEQESQATPAAPPSDFSALGKIGSALYQGATLGFGDELAGIGGGIVGGIAGLAGVEGESFGKGYQQIRDKMRGENEAFRQESPWTSGIAEGVGGLLTGIGAGKALAAALPVRSVTGSAIATGSGLGAISGAGGAKDLASTPTGMLSGAAMGGATAGVMQGAGNAIGAVGSNIAQRFRPQSATEAANRKIAEAMLRDKIDPNKLGINMQRMGPDGRVVNVGGESTMGLLDTVANLPGQTRELAKRAVRSLQIGRPERMTDPAARAMAPGGQRFASSMDDLAAQQAQARPLYEQAMAKPLTIDDDLSSILKRIETTGAFKDAERIAAATGQPFTLRGQPGETVTLNQLNEAKKLLWDVEQAAKDKFGDPTSVSNAFGSLRRQFIDKLDDITKDPATGQSVYKEARRVYAEPAQLETAMELGRKAFNQKAAGIRESMRDMSEAEKNAFRIGSFESFREMAGSQGGQSQLMNIYKDRNVQEKMRELFPNDSALRRFTNEMFKEEKRRRMESVVGGSQTARREANAEDLAQPVAELMRSAASAGSGNLSGLVSGAGSMWSRLQTPERVRDEIGRALLTPNQGGAVALAGNRIADPRTMRIADLMREIESRRGGVAGGAAVPLSQLFAGR